MTFIPRIGEEIKKRKLDNCKLLPKQSVELFFAALAATNVGVVSLSQAAANVSIPSKTFNLLGAGKPILCIGSEESEYNAVGIFVFSLSVNRVLKWK